jgi:soluble lytic murein transglycosylase
MTLSPAADSALQRVAVLEGLGMSVEGRFEAEQLVRGAGSSVPMLVGIGAGLVKAGEPGRAIAIGTRLLERGDSAWRDRRVVRLVYPLVYGDTLVHDAETHHLDPALMAAVIRQESGFDRRAVSVVGARGLMQLMPTVGQSLAQARALGPWDVELLERAEGTSSLAWPISPPSSPRNTVISSVLWRPTTPVRVA